MREIVNDERIYSSTHLAGRYFSTQGRFDTLSLAGFLAEAVESISMDSAISSAAVDISVNRDRY